ncbi:prepilin-type N-terminal cleavage/methylation domain-containing protein [Photobacterium sp. Hal280]|uniref:prepilin-type N-terminal cleavage/methylation domain-containing protein n=1 Tax=Photobacterium sp. Hal280 TaxID=3035163 RepID=UPI00301C0753
MSDVITPIVSKQQGFSLVEVLVSLLLVSVGLAGLMKLHGYLNVQADNALIMLSAVNLAESRLESLRFAAQGVASEARQRRHTEQYLLQGVTIRVETVVQPTQPGSISSVAVQASWQDRWQQPHQIVFESMFSGPQ